MASCITISAETIDSITKEDLVGTPITEHDLSSFKKAIRFSQIPNSHWERIIRMKKHQEVLKVSASYRPLNGKYYSLVFVKYIDHKKGQQVIEDRYYDIQDSLDNPDTVEPIQSSQRTPIPYPYNTDYVGYKISNFCYLYPDDYFEIERNGLFADQLKKKWDDERDRILKQYIPCVRSLPLEERISMMKKYNETIINCFNREFFEALFSPEELATELANW